jgi:hypothetical protein
MLEVTKDERLLGATSMDDLFNGATARRAVRLPVDDGMLRFPGLPVMCRHDTTKEYTRLCEQYHAGEISWENWLASVPIHICEVCR